MYHFYNGLIEELPQSLAIGSFDGWDKKRPGRRIPIEIFREILKEQGNPWAKELADAIDVPLRSPKHLKIVQEVVEEVSKPRATPVNWPDVTLSLQAAKEATRTTLAIKHIEVALNALRAKWEFEEDDDEEALLMILDNYG